ncbi:hypothetical protein KSP39_PZI004059 [Platanthera zijinensis]|uniref:Transcription initiation factor TFIID component TAF4 C-terminal domain-containing protein n=1 Tax=Platanthera zijinensis TaxID=2320716 RepID=A0AAP0BTJ7_9ASPA
MVGLKILRAHIISFKVHPLASPDKIVLFKDSISIDQLNDVTAVSGVNLREEDEQLLCAPKDESPASEASRRVVQEEEERLILQRGGVVEQIIYYPQPTCWSHPGPNSNRINLFQEILGQIRDIIFWRNSSFQERIDDPSN